MSGYCLANLIKGHPNATNRAAASAWFFFANCWWIKYLRPRTVAAHLFACNLLFLWNDSPIN